MEEKIHNVIILGSGPAGLTAGIYTARADLDPLIIAGLEYGGQLMNTTEVENFPGFPDGIMGPDLMQNMMKQAEKFGATYIYENATGVDFSGKIKKIYVGEKEFQTRSVILALGSSPRKLNIPGEDKFYGKGVSVCATCDAAFYREKVVAVVGGGDSAMEEANFLTKFASKVYVVHRRGEFRASKAMQKKVLENKKIEVLWNSEVREVLGDGLVNGIKVFNNVNNKEKVVSVDGLFLAIGHIPNTQFLQGKIELDDAGYIVAKDNTKTSVEGVFVAGDVQDYRYQQAITASGLGAMAALDLEKWLAEE